MIEGISIGWHVLFGFIIGSFLNVLIYRMHTGASIGGRSRCLSCGHTLSPRHLIPIVSYLFQRGRCAFCKARISSRYLAVEVLTGVTFGLIAWAQNDVILRALLLLFASIIIVIVVYDLIHTIIPNEYVVAAALVAFAISLYEYALFPEAYPFLLRGLGALVGFHFFAGLWYVSKGRWMGLGDAKLMVPLGLLLSFPAVMSSIVLSFWIGAVISLLLLVLQRLVAWWEGGQRRLRFIPRALTMKSEIPFAPFLVMGFILTLFFSFDAFSFSNTFFY